MYRLKQFLNSLEHYELVYLKKQINNGEIDVVKEIQDKIREHERAHANKCATCSNDLDPFNANSYSIMFGPEDFKKKASFCGLDCLEYFLTGLKVMNKEGGADAELE